MPSHQSLPVPTTANSTPQIREYNDAVLYSCNQTHVSDAEKQRTLSIVDALGLRPFAMKDPDVAEQNGLAHISVIAKLSTGQGQVALNMPPSKKRKYVHHDSCPSCTPTQAPGLEYVLSASLYAASLLRRTYIELDNGVCELFNRDWEFSPHLRFACARPLAGCLLLNNQNGQVIIAKMMEPYGRTRLVDVHREPRVIRDAKEAVIDRQTVEELRDQCTNQTKARKGLDEILSLFSGTQASIKILGNLHLNNILEVLAQLLSPYITKANASVAAFVEKEFTPSP
ncbi:hypothetical protein EC957_000845 [Mortierella hygrophila]|uniref:Uncharacterized protein n=1 Tax=Mortierella hygrophila TaxID=979708 RepID=A0A9P6F755_9FUNG|nr:hypothetical protein EC957_000845 [Mortierella hygrophila]